MMHAAPLTSARLAYRPLAAECLGEFHRLVIDPHVRRYLLDGETMDAAWCKEQLSASDALFAEFGLGLWLIDAIGAESQGAIGFCGFLQFVETGPNPQLTYAFGESHTGRGYATEAARALIDFAAQHTLLAEIHSAVDEPNAASIRVLEKLGFDRVGAMPGAFGRILQFRRPIQRN